MSRKHCGKRRNCSLQAISPFPSVFKRLVLQTRKNQGLFWKGITPHCTMPVFNSPRKEAYNIEVKRKLLKKPPAFSPIRIYIPTLSRKSATVKLFYIYGLFLDKVNILLSGKELIIGEFTLLPLCQMTSNFSFSHSVFKRLFLQTHEPQALFGKGLNQGKRLQFTLWG